MLLFCCPDESAPLILDVPSMDGRCNFASLSPDCARFQSLCDREIKIDRNDPEADARCILWHGPTGSKNLRPPETRTHILDSGKVTGDLRFRAQGKAWAARAYAYIAVHGKEAVSTALQGRTRLKLSSSCKNYRCVNPWHHSAKVITGRVIKPKDDTLALMPTPRRHANNTVWSEFTLGGST